MSDLAGGSPFKTAVLLTMDNPKIKVISGTNLPMLCEIALARMTNNDIENLVSQALEVGKDGVKLFELMGIK